jgi:hypothetical protein
MPFPFTIPTIPPADLPVTGNVLYQAFALVQLALAKVHAIQVKIKSYEVKARKLIADKLIKADKVINEAKYARDIIAIFGFAAPIANVAYKQFRNPKKPQSPNLVQALSQLSSAFDTLNISGSLNGIIGSSRSLINNSQSTVTSFSNISKDISKTGTLTAKNITDINRIIPALTGNLSDITRLVPTLGIPLHIINELNASIRNINNIMLQYQNIMDKIKNLKKQKKNTTLVRFDLLGISYLNKYTAKVPVVGSILKLFGL